MRVLWIVNMLLPEIAQHLNVKTSLSGSWMEDASQKLSKKGSVNLSIACVYGKEFKKIKINNITYYLIPGTSRDFLFYNKKLKKYWNLIIEDERPDIVHIHGTEYTHSISYLRGNHNIPTVVSIQGTLNRIKDIYYGEMTTCEVLRFRTFKEYLKFNGIIEMRMLHKKNAKYESEIIRSVGYANCVNTYQESITLNINPNINVFQLEYNLRNGFYNSPKWKLDTDNRLTIFTNPGGTPLKGLHKLLYAINIVKRSYPSIQLRVPGFNHSNGVLKVTSGYSKYIKYLIKKLNLENNITFLGGLNESEMISNMLNSRMVVIPSAIETVSLILREAMYLGVPSIASFRGGMADYITNKVDGFLYDFPEVEYLATRIIELIENDELCLTFSKNAIAKAELSHQREHNIEQMHNMYEQIVEEKRK